MVHHQLQAAGIMLPMAPRTRPVAMMRRGLRLLALALAWLVALGCAAWAFGALHYDFLRAESAVARGSWPQSLPSRGQFKQDLAHFLRRRRRFCCPP